MGFGLYHQIVKKGYECIILAPTTMKVQKGGKKVKNDNRDSKEIAECLCNVGFSAVHIPTPKDNAVKEFIRMCDDIKVNLQSIKQQIIALCTRNGYMYSESTYWTKKHICWLNVIEFEESLLRETLNEYLIKYFNLVDRIEKLDSRISEIASEKEYADKVKRLTYFIGIKEHTALSLIVYLNESLIERKSSQITAFIDG